MYSFFWFLINQFRALPDPVLPGYQVFGIEMVLKRNPAGDNPGIWDTIHLISKGFYGIKFPDINDAFYRPNVNFNTTFTDRSHLVRSSKSYDTHVLGTYRDS